MRQVSQTTKVIKWMVVALDLIVLNLMLFTFHFINGEDLFHEISLAYSNFNELFIIYNLSYLLCISMYPPILQKNKVRPEQIVQRVFTTVLWFALFAEISAGFIDHSLLNWQANCSFFILFCILLTCCRILSRSIVNRARSMGFNTSDVVFVGANPNMDDLYYEMAASPSSGYRVRGYFNDCESETFANRNIPYLGTIKDIIPYLDDVQNEKIQQLYCCLPSNRNAEIRNIISYCENHVVRFFSVPNVRNYVRRQMNMELLGEVPVLYIREEPLQLLDNRILKRTFDLLCSTIFLCTIFPIVYIIVALIIKLTSPGPIFFKQKRNGLDGKEFYCYKFRSMKVNAQSDTLQATEHDPRKTKFGDFMRKTNIDELPQFINVFLGDMSLVGPRPHMLKHTEEYSKLIDKYMVRHLIKPGITGWAQVTGCRGETKELYQMEERIKKDIWYVENWSFWLDIRIMWLTVRNMIMHNEKNAY